MRNSFFGSKSGGKQSNNVSAALQTQAVETINQRKTSLSSSSSSGRHNVITFAKTTTANSNDSTSNSTPTSKAKDVRVVPSTSQKEIPYTRISTDPMSTTSGSTITTVESRSTPNSSISGSVNIIPSTPVSNPNTRVAPSANPTNVPNNMINPNTGMTPNTNPTNVPNNMTNPNTRMAPSTNPTNPYNMTNPNNRMTPSTNLTNVPTMPTPNIRMTPSPNPTTAPNRMTTPNTRTAPSPNPTTAPNNTARPDTQGSPGFRFIPTPFPQNQQEPLNPINSPIDVPSGDPTFNTRFRFTPNNETPATSSKGIAYQPPFSTSPEVESLSQSDINVAPIDGYNTFDEFERDLNYMKQIYPQTARSILPYVTQICDLLEYEGSVMYDDYPDHVTIDTIVDSIFDQYSSASESTPLEITSYSRRHRRHDNPIKDIVYLILLNEMMNRRRRHRRRRRY